MHNYTHSSKNRILVVLPLAVVFLRACEDGNGNRVVHSEFHSAMGALFHELSRYIEEYISFYPGEGIHLDCLYL